MGKKRSGHSKKGTDWLGQPIIKHYNARDTNTGYSKRGTDFLGDPITGRYNAKGERIGYNKKSVDFLGDPITERYNTEGKKTGYSQRGRSFWGTPITEHFNDAQLRTYPRLNSSGSSAYPTDTGAHSEFRTIIVVAALIGLGIYALSDRPVSPSRTDFTPSYGSLGYAHHVEPTFDPAEFSWANDNHELLTEVLFRYGMDLIDSFDRYPELVPELRRLYPGFDPMRIGTTNPSLLAKLRDGRMLFIMSGCRRHACTTYSVCIGMDIDSGEIFLYQGGEQEQFFGRNDRTARGLLQYISAGNWPIISEYETKLRNSIAEGLRIDSESGLPSIKVTGTSPLPAPRESFRSIPPQDSSQSRQQPTDSAAL